MGSESLWAFHIRAVLATEVEQSAQAMAADGKTKVLTTGTKVSFSTKTVCFVSPLGRTALHDSDHGGVVSIL